MLKLPQEPFVVLAESFSGGISTYILEAKPYHLKGVIFVASFISPPRPLLLFLMQMVPLKRVVNFPIPKYLLKLFLLGCEATDELILEFLQTIREVPEHLLTQRVSQIRTMALPINSVEKPVAVIEAADDRLVDRAHSLELLQRYEGASHYKLAGPHFILQAKPRSAAELIFRLVSNLDYGSFGR